MKICVVSFLMVCGIIIDRIVPVVYVNKKKTMDYH